MDAEHIIMTLPSDLTTGEPGDPFTKQLISIIRGMAAANYWPLDFGEVAMDEDGEETIELIFSHASSLENAVEMAEHFIAVGGDV